MENSLYVALILKPQGIRGELKVKVMCDQPEDLKAFKKVYIGDVEYRILNVRPQPGDCAFITLKGIADRNSAEALRGKEIMVKREDAPSLPTDTFYIVDVIGCTVVTEKGDTLGKICDITPAKTDIYVIDTGKKQVPFAAVNGVITDINVAEKVVTVNAEKFNEVALLD